MELVSWGKIRRLKFNHQTFLKVHASMSQMTTKILNRSSSKLCPHSFGFLPFCLSLLASLLFNSVSLAQPQITPDMVDQLSPEQRAALLLEARQANAPETIQESSVEQPETVIPRESTDGTNEVAIEDNAEEAQENDSTVEEPESRSEPVQQLEQFGYNLFAGTPTTFAPATNIPVPMNYVMGPGDTVVLQLYGQRNQRYEIAITREGVLQFPEVGPLNVAGLTFDEMSQLIQTTVDSSLIGQQVSITMGALRSIQVFILGEAFRPGSYTISSLSTMTNALFSSGGVTRVGSLRNVRLMRNGELISELDLYDLLLRGDTSSDARLLPNDVIFIPPIGRTVGIGGEVIRPAIFELTTEETVADILPLAGGLLATAFPQGSRIERINSIGERTLVDIDITSPNDLATVVSNGDILQVYSILDQVEGIITVRGHVNRPGGFAWREGIRITDVLPSITDMLPNPDLEFALVAREIQPTRRIEVLTVNLRSALENPAGEDNILLDSRDELLVFGARQSRQSQLAPVLRKLRSQATFDRLPQIVNVSGNVLFPGDYPLLENMSISDLITMAGGLDGETELDYMVLERQVDLKGTIEVISSKIYPESLVPVDDLSLAAMDKVIVFDSNGARDRLLADTLQKLTDQANFRQPPEIVSIAGNVRFPGEYPLHRGMSVNELMDAAGWLTETTDIEYVLLEREVNEFGDIVVQNIQLDATTLRPVDEFYIQPRDRLILFDANSPREGLLASTLTKLEEQADSESNRMVVSVIGNVKFPGRYPLHENLDVEELIKISGGLTESANRDYAEITRYRTVQGVSREVDHTPISLTSSSTTNGLSLQLQSLDQLVVRQMANWTEVESVLIEGEVNSPGRYIIRKNETLDSLIERAGGLNAYADPRAAVFLRESLREVERRLLDEYRSQLETDIITLRLQQSVVQDTQDSRVGGGGQSEAIQLLDRIQTTEPTGRLVIDLPQMLASANVDDVILRDNDRLLIPRFQQEITVTGEVNRPTSHLFETGVSLGEYIERSGGITDNADRESIYIVKSNGKLEVANNSRWFFQSRMQIEPGDTVVVPFQAYKPYNLFIWNSISQIVANLSTTLLLIDRITRN